MIDPSPTGQGSRAVDDEGDRSDEILRAAARALDATQHLPIVPLVDAYRARAPLGHTGAASPAVDVAFLGRALALLGDPSLLGAARFVVETVRAPCAPIVRALDDACVLTLPESDHAGADGLALALGLVVERAKAKRVLGDVPSSSLEVTARLLSTTGEALAAAFGDGTRAQGALTALARGEMDARVHRVPSPRAPPDGDGLSRALGDGPLFVVAGATERVHALLSPFARRFESELAELAGTPDDDALYGALTELFTRDPGAHEERVRAERDDGIVDVGGALAVRFRALPARAVDPRARALVEQLAKSDASLVVVSRDARAFSEVLAVVGGRARAAIVVDEGLVEPGSIVFPDVVIEGARAHAIENALAPSDARAARATSVARAHASLGLASSRDRAEGRAACTLAFSLQDALVWARARGLVGPQCRSACALVLPGDDAAHTALALTTLAKMAASPARSST